MTKSLAAPWLGAAALLLSGCASTSAAPGFREMSTTIKSRTGVELRWKQATPEDQAADRAIHALLGRPLSVDGAVQVALLNSPELQALYEDLSLAQADVVQAGLLSNPIFSADITTAEREALNPNLIVGVTQSFLDLLLIPAKKKVAASEFDAAKYRVGSAVLDYAAKVKRAFYAVVAAGQALAVRQTLAQGQEASAELADRQFAAGNVSELAASTEKALLLQTRLDLVRDEAEVAAAREVLTRLMGLSAPSWQAIHSLPDLPVAEPELGLIEARALSGRLDLQALRQETETLRSALNLATASRWTGLVDLGADVARLKDGRIAVGPRASLELPIFNQRQAPIARLEAELRKNEQLLAELTLEARSDVRAARDHVIAARRVAELYRSAIIPARQRVVELSQQEYSAMLLGVYQLVSVKQAEIDAYRASIDALRDYWIAQAELERTLGGHAALPPSPSRPSFDALKAGAPR